jgi:hypothetical protein
MRRRERRRARRRQLGRRRRGGGATWPWAAPDAWVCFWIVRLGDPRPAPAGGSWEEWGSSSVSFLPDDARKLGAKRVFGRVFFFF